MIKTDWIPAGDAIPACSHIASYDGSYYLKSDPVLCYRRPSPRRMTEDPDWTPYIVGVLYDDPANDDRYYWVDPETGGNPDVIAWMPLPSAPDFSCIDMAYPDLQNTSK